MKRKAEEMIGNRYGMLVVESIADSKRTPNGSIKTMMNCVCDCGNNAVISYEHLKNGCTTSCGCMKNVREYEDLVGKKFGKLTVIEHSGKTYLGTKKQSTHLWKCECECGNISYVTSRDLRSGNTKSCGCISGEKIRESHLNEYDLTGEYGVGYISRGSNTGEFYFDKEDYDKIKDYTWYFNDNLYVVTTYQNERIRMHRLILDINTDVVDHINNHRNDNRKSNLRHCLQKENARNKTKGFSNTGFLGVSFDKKTNKYRAYIQKEGIQYTLGSYFDFDDAKNARIKAEKELFGEFAPNREVV